MLSNKGGVLPTMMRPIRFGVGSIFGSGKQWQSWIHCKDLAAMFVFAIENNWNGVYNAVAPNPVTHRTFMFTLARLLKKPLFVPNTPKFILKLLLGEMHVLLFDSQNVSNAKVVNSGFIFQFSTLEKALAKLVQKK